MFKNFVCSKVGVQNSWLDLRCPAMCSAVQLCYTVMYLCRMTSSVFHDVAYPSMFCVHLYIVVTGVGPQNVSVIAWFVYPYMSIQSLLM